MSRIPGVPARFYDAVDAARAAAEARRVRVDALPDARVRLIEPVTLGGWYRVRTEGEDPPAWVFASGAKLLGLHREERCVEGRRYYVLVPLVTRSPAAEEELSAARDALATEERRVAEEQALDRVQAESHRHDRLRRARAASE